MNLRNLSIKGKLTLIDFGAGYFSLSYLQRFPLDTLKIDRSFTSAMGSGGKEESMIVRAIMPLAHNLGLDVVAEGVETNEQCVLLRDLHCRYAQGFYFSRPMNAEDAQRMVEAKIGIRSCAAERCSTE